MAYKDGENFTTYCDKPYDRHKYKLNLKSGKAIIHDDYDVVRNMWFQWAPHCTTIEVI